MGECALILSVRGAEVKVPVGEADINAPPVGWAEVDMPVRGAEVDMPVKGAEVDMPVRGAEVDMPVRGAEVDVPMTVGAEVDVPVRVAEVNMLVRDRIRGKRFYANNISHLSPVSCLKTRGDSSHTRKHLN